MKVVVVGAGIVGATSALVLAERGLEVMLIDAEPDAGRGTSYANGSSLTPVHAEPWNPPGTARRLFGALFRPSAPARIELGALAGLARWGLAFLRESEPARYDRNARNAIRLALHSRQCLAALRDRHPFDYDQRTEGTLELYRSEAALDHVLALRTRLDLTGIEQQRLTAAEISAREPALADVADQFHAGLWMPIHESGDARIFSAKAALRAEALGAALHFGTTVRSIEPNPDGSIRLDTETRRDPGADNDVNVRRERIDADRVVLCTGTATPALTKPLGLRVPIYPVRGYSMTVPIAPDAAAPEVALLDAERRFVAVRLGRKRLRIAGLADFAGHARHRPAARLAQLRDAAERLLPGLRSALRADGVETWAGLRPMTPDGPPLIGPTPVEGLWLNTGHGAMGWTMAAGSADLLADLLEGRSPKIEHDGLDALRACS
jgi:D-amino-acid dehydrogenase